MGCVSSKGEKRPRKSKAQAAAQSTTSKRKNPKKGAAKASVTSASKLKGGESATKGSSSRTRHGASEDVHKNLFADSGVGGAGIQADASLSSISASSTSTDVPEPQTSKPAFVDGGGGANPLAAPSVTSTAHSTTGPAAVKVSSTAVRGPTKKPRSPKGTKSSAAADFDHLNPAKLERIQVWIDASDQGTSALLGPLIDPMQTHLQALRETRFAQTQPRNADGGVTSASGMFESSTPGTIPAKCEEEESFNFFSIELTAAGAKKLADAERLSCVPLGIERMSQLSGTSAHKVV